MLSPQRRAKPLGSRGEAAHLVPVGVCCVLCCVCLFHEFCSNLGVRYCMACRVLLTRERISMQLPHWNREVQQ
jgi:hypothetical protein